jgi:hypothetical protein
MTNIEDDSAESLPYTTKNNPQESFKLNPTKNGRTYQKIRKKE